jgi:hypothetical protein
MAFSINNAPLTGNEGYLYKFSLGSEVDGDGSTALAVGYHLVTAVAAVTGFPGETTGDEIRVGDVLRVQTGITITPVVGDKTKPITLTPLCDISSWNANFTKDEIETSRFCDDLKSYAGGKADLSGSMTGITTMNVTTEPDSFLNRFIDIAKQDGDTSYDVYEQTSDDLLVYLVSSKGRTGLDEFGLWAAVEVFTAGLGGDQNSAQTFESSFRNKSGSEVNTLLLRIAHTPS